MTSKRKYIRFLFIYLTLLLTFISFNNCTPFNLASKIGGSSSSSLNSSPFPIIFWASFPIKPDETVLVRGNNFPTSPSIFFDLLPNTDPGIPSDSLKDPSLLREISMIQSNDNSGTFTVPKDLELGLYAYRMNNNTLNLQSPLSFLNKPEVWSYMADNGPIATPGGWIELYGRSILLSSLMVPMIALVNEKGDVYKAPAAGDRSNTYYVRYSLPKTLPEGTYTVYTHNGYGGPYGWSKFEWHGDTIIKTIEVKKMSPWPSTIYEINSMTGSNFDEKFANAASLAKANGGGIIHFPAGTYTLTKPMIVPNKTLIRGDGRSATFLSWEGTITDPRTGPDGACAGTSGTIALVTSDLISYSSSTGSLCASFSLEDMTIGHKTSDEYIGIKRAYTGNEKAWFRRIGCVSPNKPEHTTTSLGIGIWIRDTINTEITDSFFDYRQAIEFHSEHKLNSFIRVEKNTFRWRMAPYVVYSTNRNILFFENKLVMADNETINGVSNADGMKWWDIGEVYGTFNSNIRDIYFINNISTREDPNPVPGDSVVDMTFDGTAGAYFGKVKSASGTSLNLMGTTLAADSYGHPPVEKGAIVQILFGKGAGQMRVLTSASALVSSVTVDEPWVVDPDQTSWVSISDYQGRYLFVGNTFTNHPRLQYYFPNSDIIVANNTIGVNGPPTQLSLWAAQRRGGFSSGMYFQVLDNKITKGGMRQVNIINALEAPPSDYPGFTALTQIFRNNVTDGASFTMEPGYSVDGILIEKNINLSSISFKKPTRSVGITVRGNKTASGTSTPVTLDSPAVIIP